MELFILARFLTNDLTEQLITLQSAGCSKFLGSWVFASRIFVGFPPCAGGAGRRLWPVAPPRWPDVGRCGLAPG